MTITADFIRLNAILKGQAPSAAATAAATVQSLNTTFAAEVPNTLAANTQAAIGIAARLNLTGELADIAQVFIATILNETPYEKRGEALAIIAGYLANTPEGNAYKATADSFNTAVATAVVNASTPGFAGGAITFTAPVTPAPTPTPTPEPTPTPTPTPEPTPITGTTYNLTALADSFSGTANNDQFLAGVNTLSAGDAISGGAGTDTLIAELAAGSTVPSTVTTSAIEILEFKALSGTATVNTTSMFGATKFVSSGAGNLVINPISQTTGASAAFVKKGNASDLSATLPIPLVAGGNEVVNLEVQGSTGGLFTITGPVTGAGGAVATDEIGTLVVQSATGDTSVFRVAAATADTLVIQGGGTVTVGPALATLANIADYTPANFINVDARVTAKATLALTLPAASAVYRTGSGDDVVTISGDLVTNPHLIDMGAGTDTLVLMTAQTAAAAGSETSFVGVDTVQFMVAGNLLNLQNVTGAMAFDARLGGAVTLSNANSNLTVKMTTESASNLTLGNVTAGFVPAAQGRTLTVDTARPFNANLTATNAQTVTLNFTSNTGSTLTALALDDTNSDGTDVTKSLTISNNGAGATVATGALTLASKLETLTVNATKGAITLGTLVDAASLTTLNVVADGGVVTLGAMGGTTPSTELNTVSIDAKTSNVVGAVITANNPDNIASVVLKATGGVVGQTTGLTITNTTGGVTLTTISGAENVTLTVNAGGTGRVAEVNATTHTGALTLVVDDNIANDKSGSLIKLGNAATGRTNTVTLDNGKDTITGGSGADSITAGDGVDSITGGAGNDTLVGGLGADIMSGGTGSDTFRIAAGDSNITARDSITDFAMTLTGNGRDTLDLPVTVIATAATVGGGGAGDDITVGGVTIASAIVAATGLTTFFSNDAATTAVTINSANALNAALQFLAQAAIVADGETVFFAASSSLGAAGTSTGFVVFQGAAGGDIAIDLVGLTGATTLGTVGADTTILLA